MDAHRERILNVLRDGREAGHGVWAVEAVDVFTAFKRIVAARFDDDVSEDDQRLAAVLANTMVEIELHSDDPETCGRCLTCQCDFLHDGEAPITLVVLRPSTPGANQALGAALCQACSDNPDMAERITDVYRRLLFGGGEVRLIRPHAAGRA